MKFTYQLGTKPLLSFGSSNLVFSALSDEFESNRCTYFS